MAALQQVSKSTSPMLLRSSLGFFFGFLFTPWLLLLLLLLLVWILPPLCPFTALFSHIQSLMSRPMSPPAAAAMDPVSTLSTSQRFLSHIQFLMSRLLNPQAAAAAAMDPAFTLLISHAFFLTYNSSRAGT
jgi:hypothetical protein